MKFAILCFVVLIIPSAALSGQLLQEADITYLGAFRVPQGSYNGQSYAYSGHTLAYYSTNNSLFMASTNAQLVSEFSIVTPSTDALVTNLNIATNIQAWEDITEGNRTSIGAGGSYCNPSGVFLGGLMVWGDKLIASLFAYYDAGLCAELSHFTSGLDLSETSDFDGMYRVGDETMNVGYRAGYMAPIPSEWQSSFGGRTAVTGRAFFPIISRSSFGPSLWTFDPDSIGVVEPVGSEPLVYYNAAGTGATLGEYTGDGPANEYISPRDFIGGVIWPPGTDTVLFVGTHGSGDWKYKSEDEGYNPAGNGSYPYHYWVWAYDADDLAASYTGNYQVTQADYDSTRFLDGIYPSNTSLAVDEIVQPYNLKPYAMWELETNISASGYEQDIHGACYDSENNIMYVAAMSADGYRPIIHSYSIDIEVDGGNITAPTNLTATKVE
jgi:hypothetical protein